MLEELLHQLDQMLAAGKLREAERFLLEQLEQLGYSTKEQSADVAPQTIDLTAKQNNTIQMQISLLNELGSFYRGCSRLKESMKAFVKVSELLQTIGQGQTVHYVTVLINIAGCLRLEGKLEESLEYFQNSRAILDNLQHQNTQDNERIKYLQATILNNISLLYIDQDKLEEALASATAAMQMITEGTGDDHELATSYNNLSNIYLKMGDYDKARAANDKALRIYDRMPKENVHHAAALLTFAKLNMGRGRLSEVREAFAQALELTEHFYGKNREYKQLKVEIEIFNEAALELECVHLDDLKSKSRNLDFYRYYDKDEYRC